MISLGEWFPWALIPLFVIGKNLFRNLTRILALLATKDRSIPVSFRLATTYKGLVENESGRKAPLAKSLVKTHQKSPMTFLCVSACKQSGFSFETPLKEILVDIPTGTYEGKVCRGI